MTKEEKLKIEYENTVKYIFHLSDIRFKLLGFVPLSTAIAFLYSDRSTDPTISFIIGVLGLIVTFGILFYDQRNTEIYNGLINSAKEIEKILCYTDESKPEKPGGTFTNRASRGRKLLGFKMWHDKALTMIYAVVVWIWTYTIIASIIKMAGKWEVFRWEGMVISALIAIVLYFSLMELDRAKVKP